MIVTHCSVLKQRNICEIALGGHGAAYRCTQNCDEIIAQACAGGRQYTGKKRVKKAKETVSWVLRF